MPKKRVSIQSTEPQARKVLEGIESRRAKIKSNEETMDESDLRPQGDDSRSAPWQKSEEEGAAELEALRAKQRARGKK